MAHDTDPSAGNTLKYTFKKGSSIPVQVHAEGCGGSDATTNPNVRGYVSVFADANCDGVADANDAPIDFNGVGGSGGLMDNIDHHLKYVLDTKSFPTVNGCYLLRVTLKNLVTGESYYEQVPLKAR
jgi:hypothetical protein